MAIECLKSALKLERVPNRQLVMKTLVIAYEQNLDFASALELMTQYVEDYPDDEEAKRELTFLETRIPGNVTESTEKDESAENTEGTESADSTEEESESN